MSYEQIAKRFHEEYERLAPEFGYETREESAKPWSEVPEQNKKLMTATVAAVLKQEGYLCPKDGTKQIMPVAANIDPCGGDEFVYTVRLPDRKKEGRTETKFQLTKDHLKLLRRSYVCKKLSRVEYGAAEIDGKRPYGNSDVLRDVAEILGIPLTEDGEFITRADEQHCARLHSETPQALQVFLREATYEPEDDDL